VNVCACVCVCVCVQTHIHEYYVDVRDRQTDRQIDVRERQTDRQIDREREKVTERKSVFVCVRVRVWVDRLKYRSLLQKSPIKETIICKYNFL